MTEPAAPPGASPDAAPPHFPTSLGTSDADTITLEAKDRTVDGNKLPDVKEVKLKRIK